MTPLYQSAHRANLLATSVANRGLVFDKFFDGWKPNFAELEGTGAKLAWINRFANQRAPFDGDRAERQRALVSSLKGKLWFARATSRFITGTGIANPLENGFVWHHTDGTPYLPGSGVKGALASFWRNWHGNLEDADRLLGQGGDAGEAIFFEMIPAASVALVAEVMTPHYAPWYQKGRSARRLAFASANSIFSR